jgi:hypothetical protein
MAGRLQLHYGYGAVVMSPQTAISRDLNSWSWRYCVKQRWLMAAVTAIIAFWKSSCFHLPLKCFFFAFAYRLKRGPRLLSRYSDSIRPARFGDRIPAGARLSAPVHTGSGAHPTSYTKGTGCFPRVKRSGRGVDHPPPHLSVEVKERVELYLYSTSGSSWPVVGCTLPLPLSFKTNKRRQCLSQVRKTWQVNDHMCAKGDDAIALTSVAVTGT